MVKNALDEILMNEGWRRRIKYALMFVSACFFVTLTGIWAYRYGLLNAVLALLIIGGIFRLIIYVYRYIKNYFTVKRTRLLMKNHKKLHDDKNFTKWEKWKVDINTFKSIEKMRLRSNNSEMKIGSIDGDGRVFCKFGTLPYFESVGKFEYIERFRYGMEIVVKDGKVLIKKDYRGDRGALIREWQSLVILTNKANIPPVYKVDEKACILYKNLIPGNTINDIIVAAGADIRLCQTANDENLDRLPDNVRLKTILKRGTDLVPKVIENRILAKMEQQINNIHNEGVANLSLTFGNIIIDEEKEPWFLDFDGVVRYRNKNDPRLIIWKKSDINKFNRIYNRRMKSSI